MPERSNGTVLKTVVGETSPRVRISPLPPFVNDPERSEGEFKMGENAHMGIPR